MVCVQHAHSSFKGELYKHSDHPDDNPSFLYQNLILSRRMFTNNWRNIGVFWLRLGMCVSWGFDCGCPDPFTSPADRMLVSN